MNNLQGIEKTMFKFQQLAKDAQSNGDPVLAQNYLQHADHYLRRYNELSDKKESIEQKTKIVEKPISEDKDINNDLKQNTN